MVKLRARRDSDYDVIYFDQSVKCGYSIEQRIIFTELFSTRKRIVQRRLAIDRLGWDFRFIDNILLRTLFNRLSTVARIHARVWIIVCVIDLSSH